MCKNQSSHIAGIEQPTEEGTVTLLFSLVEEIVLERNLFFENAHNADK
jgi:hypothetical protein